MLSLCQRFFEKSFSPGTAVATGTTNLGAYIYKAQIAGTATGWYANIPFKVPKNNSYTATFYNPEAAGTAWRNLTGGASSGASAVDYASLNGMVVLNPQAAGDNAGDKIAIHWTADARL